MPSSMTVLLAHNFYRSSAPSGEDLVYRSERALLEENGIKVIPYEKFNDAIDESTLLKRLAIGYKTAWSEKTYAEVSDIVQRNRPDIAHFHNTLPQISPSAYTACKDHGVPVVQTLHNYRLICPGALLLRDGRPCEDCVGASLVPALRYSCYRGSFAATAAVVWMLAWNRLKGTYNNLIDRYIALTHFQADRLIAGGLPAGKIRIKPNFIPGNVPFIAEKDHYAVYVGHLSAYKGVRTLLQAWREIPDLPLKVIGSGPLEEELRKYATQNALDVEFMGYLPTSEVMKLVGRALMLIVPSQWYEGFPLVILEAYACGTPVLASRIGSLVEIISDASTGFLFEPGNADDLASVIQKILASDTLKSAPALVRSVFETHYGAQRNVQLLRDVYSEILSA